MKFLVVSVVLVAVLLAFQSEAKQWSSKREFAKAALEQHNVYRRKHGVPPLKLDSKLTKMAQKWADHLASLDAPTPQHSGEKGYGENIYMNSGVRDEGTAAVDMWYNEIQHYTDYNNDPLLTGHPEFKYIGHFTQVVWKGTNKLGIAQAKSKSGKHYVVANYSPPGNYRGQFVANVLPPRA